jgi:hypothetical protein
MYAEILVQELLSLDIYVAAAIALAAAVLVMWLLHYETQLPLFISVLFVPPVMAAGFGLAVYLHVEFSLAMVQSAGILAALMVPAALLYELITDPV